MSFQELEAEKNNQDTASMITNGRDAKNKKSGHNFYTVLKNSVNPTTLKLLAKSEDNKLADTESVGRLVFEQMAKEEHIKYTYYKLGQNKAGLSSFWNFDWIGLRLLDFRSFFCFVCIYEGLYQVLLQTKTNPNHVVNGLGITYDEALEQAAFSFLELLKLLCNR